MGSRDSFSPAAAAPAARAARRRGRGTPRAAAPPSSLRRAAPSTASCTCGNMGNAGCEMWGHVTGHPQHRAPGVQRGVGLAAEEEGGRRRVHRQREVEELLDARDEEVEERAVLEPLLPELLLERRQHRLELLRLEEAGDLARGEQRVDALEQRVYSAGFDSHRSKKLGLDGSMHRAMCRCCCTRWTKKS